MSNFKIGRPNLKKPLPSNDATLQCIDWEAYQKSSGAGIVATMMICLNDLHSIAYLCTLVDKDERENKHLSAVHSGNLGLLLRTQAGILWAAHEYFVESLAKQHEISDFILAVHAENAELSILYDKFVSITKEPNFKWLNILRNNFAFHFNYGNNGDLTKKAVENKYQEILTRGMNPQSLVGLQLSKSGRENRYILGDSVLTSAWRKAYGDIPDSDNFTDDKTTAVKTYLSSVGRALVNWTEEFVYHFLVKNNLLVGEPQSAFKVFENADVGSKLNY